MTLSADHRSIYKYLDTGLLSLIVAKCDPFGLTSPAQHASRWRMRGRQTCRLLHRPRRLARMRHRENRRDHEFMLGNSRTNYPRDACWVGEVSLKGLWIGCQCCPCVFNSLWRHKLQWRHIRSKLISVHRECSFCWYIDCEKFCSLIHRFPLLIERLSY